jgi:chlorite dismutase
MSKQIAPETVDGWCVVHQIYRVNFHELAALSAGERSALAAQYAELLSPWQTCSENGQSAAYHLIGSKGDLLLLHFRKSFDQCAQIELRLAALELNRYMSVTDSFISVVEMGMYRATTQALEELSASGLIPSSSEWREAYREKIAKYSAGFTDRAFTDIPPGRYCSFYPMNKLRGEKYNWYALPIEERGDLMLEHGTSARKFTSKVRQVITGSTGYDDWEWGVYLFSDDHLVLKDIVTALRYDEVSTRYGEFGRFYLSRRFPLEEMDKYLSGELPEYSRGS